MPEDSYGALMDYLNYIKGILDAEKISAQEVLSVHTDEMLISVKADSFGALCRVLHKQLNSPVMMFFAEDQGAGSGVFCIRCVFLDSRKRSWVTVLTDISRSRPEFESIAREIYSASLFEREMKEMFGIDPRGNPDTRRLRLHDEVWPEGFYPLRKDFKRPGPEDAPAGRYPFKRVEGEGIFEVPVGPVHAGVIGPGHFRFSAAGEPIINLEIRLGWTHRGIEKLLDGKDAGEAIGIFERISGDTAFGYGLAFCRSAEKAFGVKVTERTELLRAVLLELERIYNHANDAGGIALDVGFSFPAQFASLIKEAVLRLNEKISSSRYLKGLNTVGCLARDVKGDELDMIRRDIGLVMKDFDALEEMLLSSVSFMDRADATGILKTTTARDLGVTGLAARSSGIALDMRKSLRGIYDSLSFKAAKEHNGDVASRLKLRFEEARESAAIIRQCLDRLMSCGGELKAEVGVGAGSAIGCVEAWRGPVIVWTRFAADGRIERCKIVDPSFHNWEALSFAVLGNIIPDFPLCNKSFDLSYSGNDL